MPTIKVIYSDTLDEMRLLHIETWQLQTFNNERELPADAIHSHTWGDNEVSLQAFESLPKGHPNLTEIQRYSEQALKDNLKYI